MPTLKQYLKYKAQKPKFELGAHVHVIGSDTWYGRIVAFLGPLAPRGALVYTVRAGKKGDRRYIDVREDQLELIAPEVNGKKTTKAKNS